MLLHIILMTHDYDVYGIIVCDDVIDNKIWPPVVQHIH